MQIVFATAFYACVEVYKGRAENRRRSIDLNNFFPFISNKNPKTSEVAKGEAQSNEGYYYLMVFSRNVAVIKRRQKIRKKF